MKKPRNERGYVATKGTLRKEHRQNTQNKGQPFSRTVLESGTALKTVYLSRAPKEMSVEDMEKALDNHVHSMCKELQASGKIVRKIIKTIAGMEGDVRVQALWEVLGSKPTKHYRRKCAKLKATNGTAVGDSEGSSEQSGHPATQEDSKDGPVPL